MMKAKIEKLLQENFKPQFLEVIDDSLSHAGHNLEAQKGGTHFNISIVSQDFNGKTSLERHRMIYSVLEEPLKSGVHALSIKAKPLI
ncbi:MAG: BolA family protein [Candidatus Omnitrophota bacterium]